MWLISLQSDGAKVLSPDEEIRAARFRFDADRARWIRAHSSLRTVLAGCTGVPAGEICFTLGPHGKPAIEKGHGVEFSLSHSGDWAMIAVTQGIPVGIDIERVRENVNIAALLRRLGYRDSGDEDPAGSPIELFSLWTRREAMTKAVGGALMDAPVGDFRVLGLDAPVGYAASLALIGSDPIVRRRGLVPPPGTR